MNDVNSQAVSWETYDKGSAPAPKPFPARGLYLFQVPTTLNDSCFKTGGDGQVIAEIDPLTIIGGEFAGYVMRFTRISNKRYSNRNACSMGDYLLSAQSPFRPTTDEQWKQAVLATAGQPVHIFCDWEAYDKVTGKVLAKSEQDFPLVNGVRQRYIEVPDANAQDGKRRVWANLVAKYYRAQ
jgi:hypothetical protein